MADIENERERFKAWCSDRRVAVGPTRYCPQDKQLVFTNAMTQDRFEVWQAAKSEAQADMRELVEVLDLVMDRLVDRHETDEAAVLGRAALAKHKGAHGV